MDIRDLPEYLRLLQRAAGAAMQPVDDAMASAFAERVRNETLRETSHAPGLFWRAQRGRPPAYAAGNLARSVRAQKAVQTGPAYAHASVGAWAIYAGVQEFGKKGITPVRSDYMHWVNSRGPWWKKRVTVPEHPYFRPTVEAMIRDGSFSRLASSSFWTRISYYFR